MSTYDLGTVGETYACSLLVQNGYSILRKNFSCKIGEIDIIATMGDTLVFVEVKTRTSSKFGSPEEAVNKHKLKKIQRVGEYFLKGKKNLPKKLRIDVVLVKMINGKVESAKIIKTS